MASSVALNSLANFLSRQNRQEIVPKRETLSKDVLSTNRFYSECSLDDLEETPSCSQIPQEISPKTSNYCTNLPKSQSLQDVSSKAPNHHTNLSRSQSLQAIPLQNDQPILQTLQAQSSQSLSTNRSTYGSSCRSALESSTQSVHETSRPSQIGSNSITVKIWLPKQARVPPYNEKDFMCIFNMHVHKAILPLCIISIIFNTSEAIFEALNRSVIFDLFWINKKVVLNYFFTIWVDILTIVLYFLLGIGNRKKILAAYYTYLIISIISIVAHFYLTILIFENAVSLTKESIHENKSSTENSTPRTNPAFKQEYLIDALLFLVGFLYLIFTFFQIYSYIIAFRDLRYVKNYVLNPNAPPGNYLT